MNEADYDSDKKKDNFKAHSHNHFMHDILQITTKNQQKGIAYLIWPRRISLSPDGDLSKNENPKITWSWDGVNNEWELEVYYDTDDDGSFHDYWKFPVNSSISSISNITNIPQ